MRRLLCILLCIIMLLSVAACSDDDAVTPSDDTSNNGSNGGSDVNNGENNGPSSDFEAWDTEGYHIYVSETGIDTNDGLTEAASVKTIERAQEIAVSYVGNAEKLPVIISLDKGVYTSNEMLNAISGSADTPVIYTSRNGRAVISGGTKIAKDNIKLCTDTAVLAHIQSDDIKAKLYEVDLSDYSEYLTTVLGKVVGYYSDGIPADVMEFYVGDKTLSMARWPNKDEAGPGASTDNASSVGSILSKGYEVTRHISYTDENGEFIEMADTKENKGSEWHKTAPMNVFVMDETYEVIKDWDFENEDIHIFDFFSQDWDDMIHKVTGFVDTSDSPLSFNGFDFKGYFKTDRGLLYNNPVKATDAGGNKSFRRYYFMNVLEAIDVDSEYYYDYDAKKMYIYFEDEKSLDDFYIGTNQDGLLGIKDAEHVSFRNIDIRYTQNDLITIQNANNISFIDCRLSNAADRAGRINESHDITFRDSYIYDFGAGIFYFRNNNPPSAKELVSSNMLVENCDIGFIDHRDICYAFVADIRDTTGVVIRNNRIHDGGHGAFRMRRSAVITYENNEIYNFMYETDDVGLFYGYQTIEAQVGIVIRNNYIHDLGSCWQVWATKVFYCDNQVTGYSTYGNIITDHSYGTRAKGIVFHNSVLGENYSNVIANLGENIGLTRDNRADEIFWHWRDIYGRQAIRKDDLYSRIQGYGLAKGTWDNSIAATDETRNYSYKMMKYVLSDEFYYSVYGTGIAQCTGLKEYEDADYYVQMNNETIKDFTIKVKTGTYAGDEQTFDNIDDFFDFLYDECGYTFAMTTLPNSFEIYYYGSETYDKIRVYEMYPPMYTYNQKTAEWEFSRAAGYRGINESNMWDKTNTNCMGEQMGRWQFRAENTTNLGTYHDNLTLNVHTDFTEYDHQKRYDNSVSKYNNYDIDMEEIKVVENGEYTVEFLDIVDSLKAMGELPNLVLPDLANVGCTLPRR